MKMPGGPPVINARTKINRGFRFRGVCARETRRPTYFTRPFFLVTTGTNDSRYINQGNANSSLVVRLGASWFRLQIVDTPSNTAEGKGDETIHARFE